jgi:hypothetical protein
MRRVRRSAILLTLAVFAVGCGTTKRPYAADPLFRYGTAVWGDFGRARAGAPHPNAEPLPPQAPPHALPGSLAQRTE